MTSQEKANSIALKLRTLRTSLSRYFVNRQDIIDLLILSTVLQEPLLLVGEPGTAKSELIVTFCESLQLPKEDYFEYMLTKFTEPSEILGPIDIALLKKGRYVRRIEGRLPTAKIVFLDEIFKSNSAILNTLLTIINERKFYQDGQPERVKMNMLFAATNEIPESSDLNALKDRFILKVETKSVRHQYFKELLKKGVGNEVFKSQNQKPWMNSGVSLSDILELNNHLENRLQKMVERDLASRLFPEPLLLLFQRICMTLEKEEGVILSDRKIIKLYKMMIAHAFIFHGGPVQKDDLHILRFIADRRGDMDRVSERVSQFLQIDPS